MVPAHACGIGLKRLHADALMAPAGRGAAAAPDFLEIHAENHLSAGGPGPRALLALRERFAIAVHGVGLSLGGSEALDPRHLERVAGLVERMQPLWFSEHLAWCSEGGRWFNDLLPLAYDDVTLATTCAHVQQVQERLKAPILIENPSTYLEHRGSTMDEAGFLRELVRRTGCALLLDVNNAWVGATNHGRDPWSFVAALPREAVRQIHLAGFATEMDTDGAPLLIDNHGSAVAQEVWRLYERTLAWLGRPVPTLIERDNDVPALEVLVAECDMARSIQRRWAA
jgi:uncharacterized protein (UPF0276 family)